MTLTTRRTYLFFTFGTLWCMHSISAAHAQIAELVVPQALVIVGEPIVVDLVVTNDGNLPICSPRHDHIERSQIGFTLQVYSFGDVVTAWSGSSMGCGKGVGFIPIFVETGECLHRLDPGRQLRARQLAVPLLDPNGYRPNRVISNGVPLPPGKYSFVGQMRWGNATLKTEPVDIEIIEPTGGDDSSASELVDQVFSRFMADGATGFSVKEMKARRSVQEILHRFPESVHARLARSRLLVLRCEVFAGDLTGPTPEVRAVREAKMLDLVREIQEHLKQNPGDPLERELLDANFKLLWLFEKFDPLEVAIRTLIDKFPDSTYADEARKIKERVQRYRAGKEPRGRSPSEKP